MISGKHVVALVAVLAAAVPAWAGPPAHVAMKLDYRVEPSVEGCPDERALRAALAAQLGYDPVKADAGPRLVARISRRQDELVAEMTLNDASGEVIWGDELSARNNDCGRLVTSMAISIRIGIDPLDLPPSPPPPPPTPPASPALPLKASVVAPSRPAPRPPLLWKGHVALGAALSFGSAPAPALGLAAEIGLRAWKLSLSAEGRGTFFAVGEKEGVATSLITGALLPCFHLEPAFFCGLLAAGLRRAELLDGTSAQPAFYAGAGGRVGVEIPIYGPFVGRLTGDLVGTLQPTIVRVGKEERWRSPPVSAALGLGVGASF